MTRDALDGIAIIGMAGRFPQAPNLQQFWENLYRGIEATSFFSDQELEQAGISPELLRHPHYVKARGVLPDADLFDAGFFGYSPREAELTDPQIRLFLECAWEALESAGCNPEKFPGMIGVYAGMSFTSYIWQLAVDDLEAADSVSAFRLLMGGAEKDHEHHHHHQEPWWYTSATGPYQDESANPYAYYNYGYQPYPYTNWPGVTGPFG